MACDEALFRWEISYRRSVRHISEEVLEEYVMHTLARPQIGDVEEHILICPECQAKLHAMDVYVASVRDAAKQLSNIKKSHG